ncbi:MAG: elongation factor P [Candidatus Pacebacteria bacterium]|jgi:elongation factor P|nr:elongation factor P [Candidatus Paceibacterota bacterium]
MASISFREIKKGNVIMLEGEPYEVLDRSFRAKQQREAMATVSMRNLLSGKVLEKNFQSSAIVDLAQLNEKRAQFLYRDGNEYSFMDQETYDQFTLTREQLKDAANYMKEELEVRIVMFEETPIDVVLPSEVSLKVVDCPPGVKGDTAQGGSKVVTLETGMKISTPLFVKENDMVFVKTKSGQFDRRES